MGLFDILHGDSAPGRENRKTLTASQFLGKDPKVKGYSTSDEFLSYGRGLRPSELEQLEQAFNFFKSGLRVVGSLVTRYDRSNRAYQHPSFLQGRSNVGTKIILEGGMNEFLQDYMSGEFSINFTLQELIQEAMKG